MTNPHRRTDSRAREEYLSRMSHELRTPLNAVIGFSRVLQRNSAGNQRPEDIELLDRIRANGEQLLHVVEGLLHQAQRAATPPVGNLLIDK
jgi:chemotaxis family two-component system sensor kinase Cph1